jgi:hypothetical protein
MLKRFFAALVSFLIPGMITTPDQRINQKPDKAAMFGFFAIVHALDQYVHTLERVTTAGTNSTLTFTQLVHGAIILAAGASGPFTITLPSTTSILNQLGVPRGLVASDGTFSKEFFIKNDGVGQTGTVTAGDASTTLTGTMTVATNTTRRFLLTITAATTITIENLGSSAL